MKSIKRRFKKIVKKNPCWSSYICFSYAIRAQRFSKQYISRWFNKLVEKDDYDKKDKKTIISHLLDMTRTPEDNKKRA